MTFEAKHKKAFRQTSKWVAFRKTLKKERKIDPVTGSVLSKKAQCHHCCLKDSEYEILDPDRFEMLNPKTHDLVHFLFSTKDWKKALKELTRILKKMEALNK